jgi:methylisocitrate lyase
VKIVLTTPKYDTSPATKFRKLISKDGILKVPGVFSAAVALEAKRTGFEALYFSGAAFSNLHGLPDLGVVTLTEVRDAVEKITAVTDLPIIVDVDTGFGEVFNVMRTVSEMERVRAAAIQIEDQVMPKKCGHLEGKILISDEDMVKKIIAAKQAIKHDLVVVARSDANSVEGLDSAIERARMYVQAGADVIFPEALTKESEFREFSSKVKAPLLANMTEFGKTPYFTSAQFQEMGYKIVIFPVSTFRIAMKSVQMLLREIHQKGTQKHSLRLMMTRDEFYDLIEYDSYERTDRRISGQSKKLRNERGNPQ